jgi:hypothetical protein
MSKRLGEQRLAYPLTAALPCDSLGFPPLDGHTAESVVSRAASRALESHDAGHDYELDDPGERLVSLGARV